MHRRTPRGIGRAVEQSLLVQCSIMTPMIMLLRKPWLADTVCVASLKEMSLLLYNSYPAIYAHITRIPKLLDEFLALRHATDGAA